MTRLIDRILTDDRIAWTIWRTFQLFILAFLIFLTIEYIR